jgi:hypothetical protein
MFTNMEHRFKNTPRFLSHPKQTNLTMKKVILTPINLTKKPMPKIIN